MKTEETPLVSILLPVRNAEQFLQESIRSLLSQTYTNIEIIAIEDKSTDSSFALLQQLQKKDKRLRVRKNKKAYGISVCLNRAVRQAKGQFIAFMDASDISSVHRIKKQVQYLLSHTKTVAIGTQCTYIDERGKRGEKSAFPIDHATIHPRLLSSMPMQFETIMINKLLLPKDILKFTTNTYPIVYRDVFAKMVQYGEIANIDSLLHWHRQILHSTDPSLSSSLSHAQLFVKSIIMYDYRPSLRSLFQPLIRQA